MLSFDLRSLETKAVHVDGSISPDDPIWEEGDARPLGAHPGYRASVVGG